MLFDPACWSSLHAGILLAALHAPLTLGADCSYGVDDIDALGVKMRSLLYESVPDRA